MKEQELEMAAQLGKEMLSENDILQNENNELRKRLEETSKVNSSINQLFPMLF